MNTNHLTLWDILRLRMAWGMGEILFALVIFVLFACSFCRLLFPQSPAPTSKATLMKLDPEKEIHRACREALDTAHREILDPVGWRFPPHWSIVLDAIYLSKRFYDLPFKTIPGNAVLVCMTRGLDYQTRLIRVVGCVGPRFCDVCKRSWPDDGSGPGAACPLCRPEEHPEEALTQEVERCWELMLPLLGGN